MRLFLKLALCLAMLPVSGCHRRPAVPEQPMPPHTILLSAMMRELSAQPGFAQKLLAELDGAKAVSGKKGPALLSAPLFNELRKRVLGKDWQGLDRFPGWTMREINPAVHLADNIAGKDGKLEGLSAAHPGAPAPALNNAQARVFLDLGPYSLNEAQTVSLDTPSPLPPFTTRGIVAPVMDGVVRGDGPSVLAPEHAASQRLADVLNRLSVNPLQDAKPFAAAIAGHTVHTPQDLVAALIGSGYQVSVTDSRYFANFGHLHFRGMDVMMPFWINTQLAVPHSGGLLHGPRALLVPVSHAEFEWHIRGPHMDADVSHYFGVDGKAEWRTMDTLDQAWVLKRNAHVYTAAQAVEVTRLVGLITLAYMHQHARRPSLPFGGYYTLGVCQDVVSAVETKLTGHSTLFPNTADSALFDDPRDAEVNSLFAAIPKDREGQKPQPERIFGSLPTVPGNNAAFAAITIPGLAANLQLTYKVWQHGQLERTNSYLYSLVVVAVVCAGLLGLAWWTRRQRRKRVP